MGLDYGRADLARGKASGRGIKGTYASASNGWGRSGAGGWSGLGMGHGRGFGKGHMTGEERQATTPPQMSQLREDL